MISPRNFCPSLIGSDKLGRKTSINGIAYRKLTGRLPFGNVRGGGLINIATAGQGDGKNAALPREAFYRNLSSMSANISLG